MNAIFVEAVPALSLRVLSIAFAKTCAIVVENVMFAGDKEDFLVSGLQDLVDVIELFGFGKMGDVASVQNEFRRMRQGVDLIDSGFQRGNHVRICGLVESHVAVADLNKTEFSRAMHLSRAHLRS